MDLDLPPSFQRTIHDLYSARGDAWLTELPDLIADIERRWSIRVLPHFDALSYNFVAPAVTREGTDAVLKLGVPNRELETECEALRLYHGDGIVELYAADTRLGAILMEYIRPGVMLSEVPDDEQATTIFASICRQLWRPLPPDHPFPNTWEWGESLLRLRLAFDGSTGPYPQHLVDFALASYAEMRTSTDAPMLLHGDLHHYNILTAQRQPWLAIDPKGLAGDPAYDIAQMLLNPFHLDPAYHCSLIPRRIAQLSSELGIDRQHLIRMGITHTMLSSWWSYEDHGEGWEGGVMVADTLYRML